MCRVAARRAHVLVITSRSKFTLAFIPETTRVCDCFMRITERTDEMVVSDGRLNDKAREKTSFAMKTREREKNANKNRIESNSNGKKESNESKKHDAQNNNTHSFPAKPSVAAARIHPYHRPLFVAAVQILRFHSTVD